MLARVVARTARASLLDGVVVATTASPTDDIIAETCMRYHWQFFRGNEDDVLDRYYQAAKHYAAETVVRVTGDCPLIDPEIINRVVAVFQETMPDYASNTLRRTYPRGLDVEAMKLKSLARAWREASEPWHRIHVTPYIYQNPKLFSLVSVTDETDHSSYRWTVDTQQDLEFMRSIYTLLHGGDTFSWRDVLKLLNEDPKLGNMNRDVVQKTPQEC
jgi:spore coat polysaccharide biosynthesis protein SpsF